MWLEGAVLKGTTFGGRSSKGRKRHALEARQDGRKKPKEKFVALQGRKEAKHSHNPSFKPVQKNHSLQKSHVPTLTGEVLLNEEIFFFFWLYLEACWILVCAQSCLTICDPMDCSLPGSSVCGILQARILEWVVISFSRGSFPSRDWICIACTSCIGRRILYHWATGEALSFVSRDQTQVPALGERRLNHWPTREVCRAKEESLSHSGQWIGRQTKYMQNYHNIKKSSAAKNLLPPNDPKAEGNCNITLSTQLNVIKHSRIYNSTLNQKFQSQSQNQVDTGRNEELIDLQKKRKKKTKWPQKWKMSCKGRKTPMHIQ